MNGDREEHWRGQSKGSWESKEERKGGDDLIIYVFKKSSVTLLLRYD